MSDEEHELTLDALSAAFAEALGNPSEKPEPPPEQPVEPEPPAVAVEDLEDSTELSPRTLLEAMLFVGSPDGGPLSPQRAAELMRGVEPGDISDLVAELNRRYAEAGCPYQILGEGIGYRLTLRPEFKAIRNRFYGRIREVKLSQAAIDVLAIVAYRQPITADEVAALRSAPSGPVLTQLVRRKLLRLEHVEGAKPTFRTTERFLKLFELQSLDDLPHSEDLDGQ